MSFLEKMILFQKVYKGSGDFGAKAPRKPMIISE